MKPATSAKKESKTPRGERSVISEEEKAVDSRGASQTDPSTKASGKKGGLKHEELSKPDAPVAAAAPSSTALSGKKRKRAEEQAKEKAAAAPARKEVDDDDDDHGRAKRSSKKGEGSSKKKTETPAEPVKKEQESDEEEEDDGNDPEATAAANATNHDEDDVAADAAGQSSSASSSSSSSSSSKVARELRPEKLAAFEAAEKRKGVVYMARVPPFMKPARVKQLLAPYGDLGRVYLAPEDPAIRKRRIAAGGNKKQMFTEGWIEFLSKKDAKFVAATLNNTPMGGNKRGFYSSDLWLLKYLKGFKWYHLTEKIAYENRIRAQKLRAELAAAKKEAEGYLEKAELAKSLEAKEAGFREREKKRKEKARLEGADDDDDDDGSKPRPSKRPKTDEDDDADRAGAGGSSSSSALPKVKRTFRQIQPLQDKLLEQAAKLQKERGWEKERAEKQ